MANWDKLNKELDSALDSMTQEDWINWKNKNKMIRYRKKPVEIEAIQWTGDNLTELLSFCPVCYPKPTAVDYKVTKNELFISTLEGPMKASIGDYIIKGVKGEFYPCKPDIFELTYDKIN